jgi:hypothetical protein
LEAGPPLSPWLALLRVALRADQGRMLLADPACAPQCLDTLLACEGDVAALRIPMVPGAGGGGSGGAGGGGPTASTGDGDSLEAAAGDAWRRLLDLLFTTLKALVKREKPGEVKVGTALRGGGVAGCGPGFSPSLPCSAWLKFKKSKRTVPVPACVVLSFTLPPPSPTGHPLRESSLGSPSQPQYRNLYLAAMQDSRCGCLQCPLCCFPPAV